MLLESWKRYHFVKSPEIWTVKSRTETYRIQKEHATPIK